MVDKKVLMELKPKFERGYALAQIEDTELTLEFFKQLAKENEEIQEILEDADLEVGVEVTDKNRWFWLRAKGPDIEYGQGKPEKPTFIFRTTMEKAAAVIFGDLDATQAYMAGEVEIKGNLQDALAFNDLIVVAIEAFEDLIKDL